MGHFDRAKFAAVLLQARKRAGLSQFAVAVRAGCSPPTVCYAERGCGSLATFEKLASALGVKLPAAGATTSQASRE